MWIAAATRGSIAAAPLFDFLGAVFGVFFGLLFGAAFGALFLVAAFRFFAGAERAADLVARASLPLLLVVFALARVFA